MKLERKITVILLENYKVMFISKIYLLDTGNEFFMMGFSCHSRMCPSCGKKYKDQRTIKVSEKCLEIPHRQFVFTIPSQLRNYFRLCRKPLLNALFKSVDEAFNALLKKDAPIAYKKEKRRLGHCNYRFITNYTCCKTHSSSKN